MSLFVLLGLALAVHVPDSTGLATSGTTDLRAPGWSDRSALVMSRELDATFGLTTGDALVLVLARAAVGGAG